MIALGWVTNIFQRGAASMGRLNFILNAEPNICDTEPTSAETQNAVPGSREGHSFKSAFAGHDISGEIEFRNLTFAYPTATNGLAAVPVLHDINLHIPAGSTLAIVGPTGGGKSTIATLIARLWEAPPDTLFLDGALDSRISAC